MDLKVSPVTVTIQTVNKLRDAITRGHFKPGERLVEFNLCQSLGVSRTSVREALRRLEAEKLITIIPNKGPSVTVINWEEAKQIYDVRALLEGEAAALFAARITPAQITSMREALNGFQKAVVEDDPLARIDTTTQFYEVLLHGCGNFVIRELLEGLVARINFLRARSMSRAGRGKHSAKEMQRMLSALAKRDPSAARKAAVDHVRSAAAVAREVFEGLAEQRIA